MKKFNLLVIISIITLNVFGQIDTNTYFPHVNQYLLPQIFQGENPCMSFDMSESNYSIKEIMTRTEDGTFEDIISYAQPYYTEKNLTVIGIAALIYKVKEEEIPMFRFGIMDTNMKSLIYIKDSVRLVTYGNTSPAIKFSEYFFYDSLIVNGYFYTYVQGPTPGKEGYNQHPSSAVYLVYTNDKCEENYGDFYPQWQKYIYSSSFELYGTIPWMISQNPNSVYMIFPIISEYEPNNNGLNDADIAKFSNVYPNPATSEVTVQSSFNIESIELYNMIGQLLDTKPVNAYSTSLDVSLYPKGNYTLIIHTRQGSAKKKLIVQ
ncbi:MAG: T9SS type A sorting domain-containing protein [Bacteroidales bacterium]|nr:T9SS type A sorting domain-containing protein [Bacteroidales bacterium]